MIYASPDHYSRGFHKHFAAYRNLKEKRVTWRSAVLLLFYAVECGIKACLLNKWRISKIEDIRALDKDNDYRKQVLFGHNLANCIDAMDWKGKFRFKGMDVFVSEYGMKIPLESLHEAYRYGIPFDKAIKAGNLENRIVDLLERLADQIKSEGV